MRETDSPTAMVMEDEGEGRMEADSTEISPPATVKLVLTARHMYFANSESIYLILPSRVAESLDGLLFSTVQV